MTTRSDIGRALLALVLACAAWLNGGCLDSIVSADCSETGCPEAVGGPDAGDDTPDRFVEGGDGDGDGDDADGGAGNPADAGPEEPVCEDDSLDFCTGECVDVSSDPNNCGECANQCESGICTDGVCEDGLSGHVVLIGHNFRNKNLAMGRVLGNAVFLALGNKVDVVTYRGTADADAFANANDAISAHATAIGRAWTKVPAATADDVPGLLATADVLLVYAQAGSSAEDLAALGASWAATLDQFTERNGTVIVLGGDEGSQQLLVSASMLDAAVGATVSGEIAEVVGGSDAVATNVPLHYLAPATSVSFTDTTAPVVVQSAAGAPVVLHRAIY
jgi:hypothetical protein